MPQRICAREISVLALLHQCCGLPTGLLEGSSPKPILSPFIHNSNLHSLSRVRISQGLPPNHSNLLKEGKSSQGNHGPRALCLRGAGQQTCHQRSQDGTLVVKLVFSLMKTIIGIGILCLAGAVGFCSNDVRKAAPFGVLVTTVFAIFSAYTFCLVGYACHVTGAATYVQAWELTVGSRFKWIPGITAMSQTGISCLLYSIVIGDLAVDVSKFLGLTGVLRNRNVLLVFLAAAVQLPLCLLRSLAALSYSSFVGLTGVCYIAIFMLYRWIKQDYSQGGQFYNQLLKETQPDFGASFSLLKSVVVVSVCNTCYNAHFSAPSFYQELNPSEFTTFNYLSYSGFQISNLLSILVMFAGFATFGGATQDMVLNSYHYSDKLATLGRLASLCSILGSYPLLFSGLVSSALELEGVSFADNPIQAQRHKDVMAIATVITTTIAAMKFRDLGFIAGVLGSIQGSLLIYIFPAIMHLRVLALEGVTSWNSRNIGSTLILIGGSVLGVIGLLVAVLEKFTDVFT